VQAGNRQRWSVTHEGKTSGMVGAEVVLRGQFGAQQLQRNAYVPQLIQRFERSVQQSQTAARNETPASRKDWQDTLFLQQVSVGLNKLQSEPVPKTVRLNVFNPDLGLSSGESKNPLVQGLRAVGDVGNSLLGWATGLPGATPEQRRIDQHGATGTVETLKQAGIAVDRDGNFTLPDSKDGANFMRGLVAQQGGLASVTYTGLKLKEGYGVSPEFLGTYEKGANFMALTELSNTAQTVAQGLAGYAGRHATPQKLASTGTRRIGVDVVHGAKTTGAATGNIEVRTQQQPWQRGTGRIEPDPVLNPRQPVLGPKTQPQPQALNDANTWTIYPNSSKVIQEPRSLMPSEMRTGKPTVLSKQEVRQRVERQDTVSPFNPTNGANRPTPSGWTQPVQGPRLPGGGSQGLQTPQQIGSGSQRTPVELPVRAVKQPVTQSVGAMGRNDPLLNTGDPYGKPTPVVVRQDRLEPEYPPTLREQRQQRTPKQQELISHLGKPSVALSQTLRNVGISPDATPIGMSSGYWGDLLSKPSQNSSNSSNSPIILGKTPSSVEKKLDSILQNWHKRPKENGNDEIWIDQPGRSEQAFVGTLGKNAQCDVVLNNGRQVLRTLSTATDRDEPPKNYREPLFQTINRPVPTELVGKNVYRTSAAEAIQWLLEQPVGTTVQASLRFPNYYGNSVEMTQSASGKITHAKPGEVQFLPAGNGDPRGLTKNSSVPLYERPVREIHLSNKWIAPPESEWINRANMTLENMPGFAVKRADATILKQFGPYINHPSNIDHGPVRTASSIVEFMTPKQIVDIAGKGAIAFYDNDTSKIGIPLESKHLTESAREKLDEGLTEHFARSLHMDGKSPYTGDYDTYTDVVRDMMKAGLTEDTMLRAYFGGENWAIQELLDRLPESYKTRQNLIDRLKEAGD
jgi:hypothetical protein